MGWSLAFGAKVPRMTSGVLAAVLWFYTGWYAGAFLAEMFGVSPVIGPIIGVAAAGLLVGSCSGASWPILSDRAQDGAVLAEAA